MKTDALRFFRLVTKPGGLLVGLVLSVGVFGGPTHADYFDFHWFYKEYQTILKANNCYEIGQEQDTSPFYQLLTDEIFVAWCREPAPPQKIEGREQARFHLIILTRSPTHPWAGCPKFFQREYTLDPSYLWMEKPTRILGKPLMLSDLYYVRGFGDPLIPGPKDVEASGPSLWIGVWGAKVGLMYCYQEEWLHRSDS